MSTPEDKVAVITDFLVNRASLNRVTTYDEVGRVAGDLLSRRALRHISSPVVREKVAKALQVIDTNSLQDKGVLLSALVVHFWDNEASHRFHDQAVDLGVADSDTDPGYRKGFHAAQLVKVFEAYPEFIAVDLAVAGDDEDDEEESEDLDEEYQDA